MYKFDQYHIHYNPSENQYRCNRKDSYYVSDFPQYSPLFFFATNFPIKGLHWSYIYVSEPQHFLQQFLDKEII